MGDNLQSSGSNRNSEMASVATGKKAYKGKLVATEFPGKKAYNGRNATVGLMVVVFLDNTLEVEKSKKDRGMPWWVKFRTFRGDNRNEEFYFYTLPFNLNT